ncbi:MAG TPA: hypothetical protein VKF38_15260 [Anaerolineaceae bacterium]|nr:hypothetical protein [Anaerolineaceae bacterium]
MNAILSLKKYLAAGIIVSLLVGAILLVLPAVNVAAAAPDPTVTPATGNQTNQLSKLNQRLENRYQREQTTLSNQGNILNKLSTITSKAQNVITRLNNRGLDTSSLEQALTTFQGQILTGQTYYNNAKALLSTHFGFDNNGMVVDSGLARTTLQSAHQDFVSVRQTLLAALKNLRQTIKEFRQANRPNQQNPSTPFVPTPTVSQS